MNIQVKPVSVDELTNSKFLARFLKEKDIDFKNASANMYNGFNCIQGFDVWYFSGLYVNDELVGISTGVGPIDKSDVFKKAKNVFESVGIEIVPDMKGQKLSRYLVEDKIKFARENGFDKGFVQTAYPVIEKWYESHTLKSKVDMTTGIVNILYSTH